MDDTRRRPTAWSASDLPVLLGGAPAARTRTAGIVVVTAGWPGTATSCPAWRVVKSRTVA
ncbi:hypothetical protein [Streptomyces canus]|uniref:hypothetical protein n=1 Tax=Streptomyces canus TaxID=58343 RepID=UPI002E28704E|nr:hypothetical protein [Streptomyces canus]